ncbi:nucleotide exchange factor GrpE, partial [Streptomyces sp. NPDC097704]|uniref:nucleotide exchange factor GrpE n=1 Tax=Streptomyces sp. NPDC097704 TaxID=3157101 RepID=UPI00332648F1
LRDRDRNAERYGPHVVLLRRPSRCVRLALAHAGSDPQAVVEGVKAIRDQAVQVLSRFGFERHDEVGVPFSPELHEVVSVVTRPDLPSGTVVEVLRPGYGEDGRQLRPAAVVVSRPEG